MIQPRARMIMSMAMAIALALLATPNAQTQDANPTPVDPNAPSLVGTRGTGAHSPITPPFIAAAGALPQRPSGREGDLPTPYIAGARQFLVQTGQSWGHVIAQAQPGDEIIFPAGFHVPQMIDGLQGTREKPIFLRSRDRVPAAIACEQTGWTFRRCKHLVVENLLFLNPREVAIVVDGAPVPGAPAESDLGRVNSQPWSAEIMIRQCTIAGTRVNPEQDAIRVRNVQDVRLDSIRVDGWNDAAIEIDASRRILVRALMMVPIERYAQRCGVRVLGASSEIAVTGCSFNKTVAVGVSVGSPAIIGADGQRSEGPAVEHMRVDRCIFEKTGTPLEIINARDLVLSRVTIVNPSEAIYAIPDNAGAVDQVLIEKAVAFWFPGVLRHFSPHPARIPPAAVTLADNLWYSAELPDGWEALGAPFGYQSVPQVTGIDPSIDIRTLRAMNPDAVRFGAHSLAAPSGARPGPAEDAGNYPPPSAPVTIAPAPGRVPASAPTTAPAPTAAPAPAPAPTTAPAPASAPAAPPPAATGGSAAGAPHGD